MTALFTLDDLPPNELRGARIFLRVDFNVPLTEDGEVADTARL